MLQDMKKLKNAEKSNILLFLAIFKLLSDKYVKKLVVTGRNVYIQTIATNFQDSWGCLKLHKQLLIKKMLKISFFYLKSAINKKI